MIWDSVNRDCIRFKWGVSSSARIIVVSWAISIHTATCLFVTTRVSPSWKGIKLCDDESQSALFFIFHRIMFSISSSIGMISASFPSNWAFIACPTSASCSDFSKQIIVSCNVSVEYVRMALTSFKFFSLCFSASFCAWDGDLEISIVYLNPVSCVHCYQPLQALALASFVSALAL